MAVRDAAVRDTVGLHAGLRRSLAVRLADGTEGERRDVRASLVRAGLICRWWRLSNLTTVDLGDALHFVQETHPATIGTELSWYAGL